MRKFNQGITLFELLVTLTIVGILAALAVPAFDNQIKNSRLKSSANQLLTAYSIARSEAINRNAETRVSGDSSGWTVETVASAGPPVVASEVLNTFSVNSSGVTWTPAALPVVTYNSTGYRPFGSAAHTIEIKDNRGEGRTVTISASGTVKVEKL